MFAGFFLLARSEFAPMTQKNSMFSETGNDDIVVAVCLTLEHRKQFLTDLLRERAPCIAGTMAKLPKR